MKRYLNQCIAQDLPNKVVLIMGPRQCGKTTLAKQLYSSYDYLNYDAAEDRHVLLEKSWDRNKKLIIFDEIHKMKDWKRWLKGIYDTEGIPPQLLVTGSARLDVHRKVGDSLAGRYFQYRLHPFDLKEVKLHFQEKQEDDLFQRLWGCSGFPEPFMKGSESYYRRWRRTHIDIILRQDLIDLHAVRDIRAIETLVHLLKGRVGGSVSYANLARDLERDANTIKRWLELLENLHIIFRVRPYASNIARSLLKEPKFYFYDHTYADEDKGARLENIVACALLKELQYIEDVSGISTALNYLRTRDGKEVDFLVCIDDKPFLMIEVKWADDSLSQGLTYFAKLLPGVPGVQLVKELKREKTFQEQLEIRKLVPWLGSIQFDQH